MGVKWCVSLWFWFALPSWPCHWATSHGLVGHRDILFGETSFNLLPSWISFQRVLLSSRRRLLWVFITRSLGEKCWGRRFLNPFPSRKLPGFLCIPELYSPRDIQSDGLSKLKKNKVLPITSSLRVWGILLTSDFFSQNKDYFQLNVPMEATLAYICTHTHTQKWFIYLYVKIAYKVLHMYIQIRYIIKIQVSESKNSRTLMPYNIR